MTSPYDLLRIIETSGSLEPEVYHFTSPHNALSILQEKRIALAPVIGSLADMQNNKGKFYFFSTSRSPSGRYAKVSSETSFANVQLVFDRDKLKSRAKIVPVDHWGQNWDGQRETEDRVVSDKPFMNLSSLKAVHVALPLKEKHTVALNYNKQIDIVRQIAIEAIRGKFGIFLYEDRKAFLMINKKRSLSRAQWKAWLVNARMQTTDKPWTANRSRIKSNYIDFALYTLRASKWADIPKHLRKYMYHAMDIEPQIAADIHNYRAKANSATAQQARELIVEMKKFKIKTLKELTNHVLEKSGRLYDADREGNNK